MRHKSGHIPLTLSINFAKYVSDKKIQCLDIIYIYYEVPALQVHLRWVATHILKILVNNRGISCCSGQSVGMVILKYLVEISSKVFCFSSFQQMPVSCQNSHKFRWYESQLPSLNPTTL